MSSLEGDSGAGLPGLVGSGLDLRVLGLPDRLPLSEGGLPHGTEVTCSLQGLRHDGSQPVSKAIAKQEQKQFSEQTREEGEEKEEKQQGLTPGQQLSSKEADLWVSQTQVELSGS